MGRISSACGGSQVSSSIIASIASSPEVPCRVANDYLLDNPRPITEGWKSLKAAGFEYVTTIVPNAQSPDQPWVFSGYKYVRISISGAFMKVIS